VDTIGFHTESIEELERAVQDIKIVVPAAGEGGSTAATVWGAITGTLADQTDLQDALDLKYDASNPDGFTSNAGTVTSVSGGTGLTGSFTVAGSISLNAATIASLGLADTALQDITGLVSEGTNVTITGTGTSGDPYVINSGGSSGVAWGGITGILADQTDLDTALGLKYDASNPDGYTTNVGTVTSVSGGTGLTGTVTASGSISLNASTIASLGLADTAVQDLSDLGITATAGELNILDGVTATTAELNYLDGVTSSIQAQLDAKSTPAGTETLTNKRVSPRVTSTASASSLTPTKVTTDRYIYTALAANFTLNNPTMDIGETLAIQITDNATSRTLAFGTDYKGLDGLAIPTATTISKTMEIICSKVASGKVLVSYVNEA